MDTKINTIGAGLLLVFLSACAVNDTASPFQQMCSDPRPQMCTMDYRPVCGVLENNSLKTYSNGCGACSDPQVQGYNPEVCSEE